MREGLPWGYDDQTSYLSSSVRASGGTAVGEEGPTGLKPSEPTVCLPLREICFPMNSVHGGRIYGSSVQSTLSPLRLSSPHHLTRAPVLSLRCAQQTLTKWCGGPWARRRPQLKSEHAYTPPKRMLALGEDSSPKPSQNKPDLIGFFRVWQVQVRRRPSLGSGQWGEMPESCMCCYSLPRVPTSFCCGSTSVRRLHFALLSWGLEMQPLARLPGLQRFAGGASPAGPRDFRPCRVHRGPRVPWL